MEAHKINKRFIYTIAALNMSIDISTVQRVWKCQRNEWRSYADFRLITILRYMNKEIQCSCIIAGFCALIWMATLHSISVRHSKD